MNRRLNIVLSALAIAILVMVAYIPAMQGGYVWDDDFYVTNNRLLTDLDGLKRIWFSLDSPSQYFPLVYTTFRIEHAIWGFDPTGYHVVNVILHIINALLVWAVLRRLRIPGAWLAAAVWALHPVNVESVAWITERKNTLSTVFYLTSLLAWMRFADEGEKRRWRYYALSLVLFQLALFAKTTACTLPAALLLVLWIREKRIDWRRLAQVAPYVVLGLAMGLVSIWWEQHHQGTRGPQFAFTPIERILIASRALWFYLGKLVWPSKLVFSYPKWDINPSDPAQYVWLIGCALVIGLLWWKRRVIGRGPVAALVFFTATLAPMLGFVSLYTFRYTFVADHYQYVVSMGLMGLVGHMGALVRDRWRTTITGYAVPGIILAALGILTWWQGHAYRDIETLWRDTIAKHPTSWFAHNNLGVAFVRQGKLDEAIGEFEEALHIKPDHAGALYNLGSVYGRQKRYDAEISEYRKALHIEPKMPDIHNNLAVALYFTGRYTEAWEEVRLTRKYGAEPNPEFVKALSGKMRRQ